ncbi:hypothetical protein ACB098_05G000100 [Castanea mollissima]
MAARDNPLRKSADSIQALADTVNSENPRIKVSDVVQFCRLNYTFLFYLGIAIKFTDLELQTKVDNLVETSMKYDTIQTLVETEIKNGFAKDNSSHCRNLVRLKRIINLVREVMERILEHGWRKSLVEIFAVAYEQVFAPYHGWNSSDGFILSIGLSAKAVIAALERLPSNDLILQLLNEDEESVKEPIQKYITAAKAVLQYVDNLFLSSETGAELLRLI